MPMMQAESTSSSRLYDRIAIIGLSGSGKTTLAVDIAARLNLKHVELDALHWEPNWVEAPNDVMLERVQEELPISGRWVTDGNYSPMRKIVWARGQTLIWLDYPLSLTMWRVVKRTLGRMFWQPELWNGNRESAWRLLSLDEDQNIILYAYNNHAGQRARFTEALGKPEWAHLNVLRFQSPAETEAWLAGLVVEA